MHTIGRKIYQKMLNSLEAGQISVLYGPRRTGKTTILEMIKGHYENQLKLKVVMMDGEDVDVQKVFSSKSVAVLENALKNIDLLILDEAQKIEDVGISLKLIADHFKFLKVIASGSASFDLSQKLGEPLTGRKKTFILFPLSFAELLEDQSSINPWRITERQLIYGSYPKTATLNDGEVLQYLKELSTDYLFKDILEMENIKNSNKLRDLLVLLAFQIGYEVSLSELGNKLDLHKDTVAKYLDLLEKTFVIFNVRGFSRNLRNEVSKTSRFYFYDNGIRNTLIQNFNSLDLRSDQGQLWENYLAVERLKIQNYEDMAVNNYFWRTYDKNEIDWVEESGGNLKGFEFKFGKGSVSKATSNLWKESYENASIEVVDRENYVKFLSG